MTNRSGDEIAAWMSESDLSKSRVFKFDTLRESKLVVTRHTDNGGAFYTLTITRAPIEIAVDIATLFENCRGEP